MNPFRRTFFSSRCRRANEITARYPHRVEHRKRTNARFAGDATRSARRSELRILRERASLWEIAIKWRLGKLQLSGDLERLPDILTSGGLEIIPINERHVLVTVQPEPMTRDPFDRLLLAQCSVEELRLVTVDRALISHTLAIRTHT